MSAIRQLREACADVWQTTGGKTISDILEDNYKLSPETEGDPGSYDVENNPYWRKVLNCADDPEVRKVSLLKSTQVGGTILVQGIVMSCAVVDPSPCMYVTPDKGELRIQRDRMYGNALVSNDSFRKLVPPKTKWSMDVIKFGSMNCNAAWAGSPQKMRGKPCKRVFLNEVDVYTYKGAAGNAPKSAEERTKQFHDSLIFAESTPVGDESYIYGEWEKSNKERWIVKCPHCQKRQSFSFFVNKKGKYAGCGGITGYRHPPRTVNGRTVAGDLMEPEEAARKAYYVCINGCKIDPRFKNPMVRGGDWCPEGQKLEDVELHGPWMEGQEPETIAVLTGEPKRSREHSGFHVWTIMQHKISIGMIAAAYINHFNDGKLRDFFQNWLGWIFRIGQRVPSWEVISKKYTRGYDAGTVPDKCWFLTAAADVQEDLVYWMVMGWGPMRTPYLIGWGEIYKQEEEETDDGHGGIILASDLAGLVPAIMTPYWPVSGINPAGKSRLGVRLAGVDSNYRPFEVHDLVRTYDPNQKDPDKKRLRCIRGDDAVKSKERFRKSVIEKNTRSGKEYADGGMHQWQLARTHYQDVVAEKLLAAPNQPGALHLPRDILPAGKKVLRQLCNVKKNDKGFYVRIDGGLGKDYRDLFGYNLAMADMVVGKLGWTEKAWRDDMVARQRASRKAEDRRRRADNRQLDSLV